MQTSPARANASTPQTGRALPTAIDLIWRSPLPAVGPVLGIIALGGLIVK
jgi:hypothetical protein